MRVGAEPRNDLRRRALGLGREGMGPRIREDTGGPIGAETRLALAVKRINASDDGRLRIRDK